VVTYLVVAAHPDDPDFGVAGSAARLAQDGHAVHYLMCTSGDAGSDDPTTSAEDLVRIGEAEQQAAGEILGLAGVHFLRFPDGELEPSIALRNAIVREMRRLKADVVLCQDPRAHVDDAGSAKEPATQPNPPDLVRSSLIAGRSQDVPKAFQSCAQAVPGPTLLTVPKGFHEPSWRPARPLGLRG
jgi:GlcNAc-PI de-N-acetylase